MRGDVLSASMRIANRRVRLSSGMFGPPLFVPDQYTSCRPMTPGEAGSLSPMIEGVARSGTAIRDRWLIGVRPNEEPSPADVRLLGVPGKKSVSHDHAVCPECG